MFRNASSSSTSSDDINKKTRKAKTQKMSGTKRKELEKKEFERRRTMLMTSCITGITKKVVSDSDHKLAMEKLKIRVEQAKKDKMKLEKSYNP